MTEPTTIHPTTDTPDRTYPPADTLPLYAAAMAEQIRWLLGPQGSNPAVRALAADLLADFDAGRPWVPRP
jgi:hypothetical protein